MRELCLPEDLHPGLTGQTGLETGPKCPVRVRSGILTRDLIGFRLLTGILLMGIYMKGHGRLRVIPIDSTTRTLLFISKS